LTVASKLISSPAVLLVKLENGKFDLTYAKSKSKHFCRVKFCTNPSPRSISGNSKDGFVCARCKRQRWRANNPEKSAYAALRDHARGRKVSFKLSFDEFVDFCKGNGYIKGKGTRIGALHIDRIDGTKGYSRDNIQIMLAEDNSRKGALERATGKHYKGDYDYDDDPYGDEDLDLTSPVRPDTPEVGEGEDPF
jgi:hypothetical protein